MDEGALGDLRVISLGSVWAGPYVGRMMAEAGAEVIRIALWGDVPSTGGSELQERWIKAQVERGMSREEAERATKASPGYSQYQCNNYSLGLNLRSAEGKEIYRKLVKNTDIIIDGWSARVMANLGLDYSALIEIKPDIIYVSIPALGMTGPDIDVRMFGSGCEALAGLDSIRGYPDGRPFPSLGHIPDPISANHILTALLAALYHRNHTGKGQHIDISQTECSTLIMGEAIMDYSMNKRIAKPTGNRHSSYAPHNAYRCKGDDRWVTIAVTTEEEWSNFCNVIGNPSWTRREKFTDMLSRWQNQEEMDKLIEKWTTRHDHYAVQDMLQQAGVPAAAVVNLNEHIRHDPQVKDRNVYTWLKYHDGIDDPVFRVPWVLTKTPTSLNWCGPYVGQHNDYILEEILGISKEEITELTEKKVVGATTSGVLA